MSSTELTAISIDTKIHTIRGVQVMIGNDLAQLYQVELRVLMQAVQRNQNRFPSNFMFQLNSDEWQILKSQFVTSSWGGTRKLPYAFTEQGVAMLSGVLRSETAIQTSIQIINAFVQMRQFLTQNGDIFKRLHQIEARQITFEHQTNTQFNQLFDALEHKQLTPKQGIFYDGEVFDAYQFVCDLVRSAKQSIILVDNYLDESVLTLLSKRSEGVTISLYTPQINEQLKLDIVKFNQQYPSLSAELFKNAHDRFLIIDELHLYHFGASLKDLGKKWFAFSKMDISLLDFLRKLQTHHSKDVL
jgi:hypothetical protein